jgi:hypothetical protein
MVPLYIDEPDYYTPDWALDDELLMDIDQHDPEAADG